MALIDQYNLTQDQQFAYRVQAALTNALFTIQTEDPTTINHAARVAWVKSLRTQPGNIVEQLREGCAAHPTVLGLYIGKSPIVSGNVDDATLQTVVNALITSAVGV